MSSLICFTIVYMIIKPTNTLTNAKSNKLARKAHTLSYVIITKLCPYVHESQYRKEQTSDAAVSRKTQTVNSFHRHYYYHHHHEPLSWRYTVSHISMKITQNIDVNDERAGREEISDTP